MEVTTGDIATALWLADWRRATAELYAAVRVLAPSDPVGAWEHWRTTRERLFRQHPQSPIPVADRAGFRARHFPYDPAWRFEAEIRPLGRRAADPAEDPSEPGRGRIALPSSGPTPPPMQPLGTVELALPGGTRTLTVFWLEEYSGGLFLPFGDATNGRTTYGAGRYLLDTAKGADLGSDPATGRLRLDFNFAYHPSCAFDPRWVCPLAPPEDRLRIPIDVGERLA